MEIDRDRVEQFVYREARLADEHRYDEWEALWTDDGHYWVPADPLENPDPNQNVSIINDIRPRITTRVEQLKTGHRHSQDPPTRLRRMITNLEIGDHVEEHEEYLDEKQDNEVSVGSNFFCVQHRRQDIYWAGRTIHRLRELDGGLKMSLKKVLLVNNLDETPTLTFLI